MRSILVVELDPEGDLQLGIGQIEENLRVKALTSERTHKALGKAVLPRTSWLDANNSHPVVSLNQLDFAWS